MFVVFEGIDGSGKTTVSNRVAARLAERGLRVKHVRADGKFASPVTEAVRAFSRDARNLALVPKAELLLYVAREVQLLEETLQPALATHDLVIADRFLSTPEVLGRFGRKLEAGFVSELVKLASGAIAPDLTLLIDIDPSLARARRKASKSTSDPGKAPARKGLSGRGLQQRLRLGYLELAKASPSNWAVIDNDARLEQSVERVCALIEAARADGVAAALAHFQAECSAPRSPRAPLPRNPAEALARFRDWLSARAESEPRVAAQLLAGFRGPRIDDLRREFAERAPERLLLGLAGLSDETSFALRERHAAKEPRAVALSLRGVPAEHRRAAALRLSLFASAGAEVASSLSGDESDEAWGLRQRLFAAHPEAVLASLGWLDSERAWALRQRWLAERGSAWRADYAAAHAVARSVRGLASDRAWSLREAARESAPVAALRSLAGLDDERAFAWRQAQLVRAPAPVIQSLGDLRSGPAWELRAAVAADCQEALDGIAGADNPEAWWLRARYADVWPSTVLKSLGALVDGERGAALLERQLAAHGDRLGVLRHAARFALGLQREPEQTVE